MFQYKKSFKNKHMSVVEALDICRKLPKKEHARIVDMIIDCVGRENLDTLAVTMHKSAVQDVINNKVKDINDVRPLISSFLMILYIQGSIVLREKEKS